MAHKRRSAPQGIELSAKMMLAQCHVHRVRLINRTVTEIYDRALRGTGAKIRISQMNILGAVAHLNPATPAKVCRFLHMNGSTLSRNLMRMKAHGWLRSEASNGRKHIIQISRKGKEVFMKGRAAWEIAQKETRAFLGKNAIRALHVLADGLLDGNS